MEKIELLNTEERLQLPFVLKRRATFQRIMKNSLKNAATTFSNCLMVQGKAGTGKTTTVVSYLDILKQEGVIYDYRRVAGHITPRALFTLLLETAELHNSVPSVLVLDDCDLVIKETESCCSECSLNIAMYSGNIITALKLSSLSTDSRMYINLNLSDSAYCLRLSDTEMHFFR